ncbi:hypothetical protein OK016_17525 [Vibrio chagasii]|nr:hypothetical protein [Vibrio chagasii]
MASNTKDGVSWGELTLRLRNTVKVGDIVSPNSYLSTSISKTSSYTFHNGQLSRFELNLGQHGIVIPTVRDELEVLVNRNSLFEVTAINTTPEGNQVIYREVSCNQIESVRAYKRSPFGKPHRSRSLYLLVTSVR